MPPTGCETAQHNFDVIVQLGIWVKQDGTGVGFGSSGGFTLPNGAVRKRSRRRYRRMQRG
ncbi:hypothetical protein [Nostoc sp.]